MAYDVMTGLVREFFKTQEFSMDQIQNPHEKIASLKASIQTSLTEIEDIADANSISVYFGGPGYGFGGTYNPKPISHNHACELLNSGVALNESQRMRIVELLTSGRNDDWQSSEQSGWVSSSSEC